MFENENYHLDWKFIVTGCPWKKILNYSKGSPTQQCVQLQTIDISLFTTTNTQIFPIGTQNYEPAAQ